MSTTIDQRVVEMRFDNQHFEKNVSTTMSTLDKLKQKLNLSGASKGLENIDAASKKINMTGLGNAVESVSAKFTALQVMGVTALANITNSAINAGKSIVKSLTIDPIKSGFNEYELKMNSIQTIMAGTGESLATVNQYLNELNEYSDKTIYSFQDMTTNIGKFTNAGVKLKDAVAAIQGISNEAAVSGASASQASHAMYNLAQALSSGYVKLIDWKSIENAQMATVEFKEQLIETAVAMGTLNDVGGGMYETLEGKALNATKGFNDTLQDQWMTSDVLIETLKRYSDETTEIGAKATEAATKVKTFTQLMDTMRESAQSGWAQTWELIVGDFEEARSFFTELSDLFGGIIGKSAGSRNALLGDALTSNWDKLVTKIGEAGIKADDYEESVRKVVGEDKFDSLIKNYESLDKAVKAGKISSEDLKKALDNISSTDADTKISGFVDGLKEIERTLSRGHVGNDVKKLQTALSELGYDLGAPGIDGIIGPITEKAIKAFQEANGIIADGLVGPETLAALEAAGTTVEKIEKNVDKLGLSASELFDELTKPSGRELLLDSMMNIIKAVQRPLDAIGEAWRNTFSVSADQIYDVLKGINKFTKSLTMEGILDVDTWDELLTKVKKFGVDTSKFTKGLKKTLKNHDVDVDQLIDKYGSLEKAFDAGAISIDHIKEALLNFDGITESLLNGGETADKVRRTFEGLFAIFDIIGTVLSGPLKFGFKVISGVLENLGLSILDITARIGDGIVKFRDKIDKVTDSVTSFIVDGIVSWIEQLKETEMFKTVAEWCDDASKTISDAVDNISKKIKDFNTSTIVERLQSFYNVLADVGQGLKNNETFVYIVDSICGAFSKLWNLLPKIKIPEFNLDNLKTFATDLVKIGEKINVSGDNSIIGALAGFGKHIKDNVISWNWTVFKETALEKFVNFWLKTGDKITAAFKVCKDVASAIVEFIFGTEQVNLPTILSMAEKFLGLVIAIKALSVLNNIVEPFDNVTDALNNFAGALKWEAMSGAFKSMALAIGVFTVCILMLTQIGDGDMKKAWSAAGMLIALMVVMGGVVSAIAFLSSKIDGGVNAVGVIGSLLMLTGALVLLVYAIKEIDKMDLKHPLGTWVNLGVMLLALTTGVKMISKAAGSSFRSVAAILTLVAALKLILEVIEAYDAYDWSGKGDAIWRMVEMLTILSVAINIASRGVKSNASASGLALLLFAMVVSLKILLDVMDEIVAMDTADITKGVLVIATLMGLMTGMIATINATNKGGILEKGQKSVNNFTGLAIALLGVVAAIWLLGKMDIDTLKQGGIAVAGILAMFTIMLSTIGKSCAGLKMGSIITMMIAIGVLMAEMAIIIHMMKGIPLESSVGSAGALVALLLSIATVLRVLTKHNISAKNIFKWISAMAVLGLVVAELAVVLHLVSKLDPVRSIGNVIALSGLLAAMAGVLVMLTKHRNGAKSIYKWIGAMAALGLVVAELAIVLHLVKDIDPINAIGNVVALSGLLLALTVALTILSACKVKANVGAIGAIALLGLVAAELAGVMYVMQGLDPAKVIPQVVALSILVTTLSLVLVPLALVGTLGASALIGVGSLAVLAASLFILVGVLATMTNVSNASANATLLAGLVTVLTLVLIPLSIIGAFSVVGLIGVGILATLMASLFIVVGVLASMQGIENAEHNAEILITLLTTMTDVLVAISAVAPLAAIGVVALGALVGLIRVLGTFIIAIGAMVEWIPEIETFINTGLEVFKTLARGLGEMVSEFAAGLTSSLPEIGANLSAFVSAASPFLTLVRDVDDQVATGAGNLTKAILMLLAADFIAGIADLCNISLTDLAIELSGFAEEIKPFLDAMTGIKSESAVGIQALCDAMTTLTKATFWDNVNDLIFGEGTLASFGTSMAEFAGCMKEVATSLKDITDADVENIRRSATAGTAMAELNASIPRKGGWVQDIVGEKDLATFGKSIIAFADCLIDYSAKVSGEAINADAITTSATAAKSLADLNDSIPRAGGWWQDVAGAQDLAVFGQSICAFADCLVQYSSKIVAGDIDADAITSSAKAADALATLEGKLPKQGGWWQEVVGAQDIGTFGSSLIAFAEGILSYSNTAAQIDDTKITAIENSGKAIDKLVEVVDKVPESGGWGDKIFGSNDGQGFGGALKSMATGISSYCDVASSITDDDLTAIDNSKNAVTKLSEVISETPETADSGKAAALKTAVVNLKDIAATMHAITAAAYDYSGLDTLKTKIKTFMGIVGEDVDAYAISSKFGSLVTATRNAAGCAVEIASLAGKDYSGVEAFKKAIGSLAETDIDAVIKAFSGKAGQMTSAMKYLTDAMSRGLSNGSRGVTDAIKSLVDKAVVAAENKATDFKTAGKTYGSELVDGINNKKTAVSNAGKSLGVQAASGAKAKYDSMYDAGEWLGDGLVDGIDSKWWDAYNAGYELGQAAVEGEKDGQASNSPSKLTIQAGKWLGEGLVIGMDKMSKNVYTAGSSLGKAATSSMSSTISRISDAISTDIDAQPTIRPVLDLSDVRSGAAAIGGMFNTRTPIGVMANVGAINSMMNGRIQNGSNSDVVSAINKLGKVLGNSRGDTYQVNGVTYDDGSNVATAVKEIVRAARTERRV